MLIRNFIILLMKWKTYSLKTSKMLIFWQDCAYIWKKEVLVLVSTTVPTFQMAAHIHLILLKPYIPVRLKFDSRKFL